MERATTVLLLIMAIFGVGVNASKLQKSKTLKLKDFTKLLIPSLFPNIAPYINVSASADDLTSPVPAYFEENLPHSSVTQMIRFFHDFIWTSNTVIKAYAMGNKTKFGRPLGMSREKMMLKYSDKRIAVGSLRGICTKDLQSDNGQKLIRKYGHSEFPFVIPSFVLPREFEDFKASWETTKDKVWVLKPSMGSNSKGVHAITHWNQAQGVGQTTVVQKYISNPYLIEGSKSEFRFYVVVTGLNPLRIFLSNDGLVKLGYSKFTMDPNTLNDTCVHFRFSTKNEDKKIRCQNQGKSFSHVHEAFDNIQRDRKDFDLERLKDKVEDAVVKSILSIRFSEHQRSRKGRPTFNSYNTFHFVSFDFFIDDKLEVWLNEVNGHPIFDDMDIESAVEAALIAGYHLPPTLPNPVAKTLLTHMNFWHDDLHDVTFDEQLYSFNLTKTDLDKHAKFEAIGLVNRSAYLESIIDTLTPDDVRRLIVAEDELHRSKMYKRLLPSRRMSEYFRFLDTTVVYYYMLFDAWEEKYGKNRTAGQARLKQLARAKFHQYF
jgi:tubulin polyglutamylase TTLL4